MCLVPHCSINISAILILSRWYKHIGINSLLSSFHILFIIIAYTPKYLLLTHDDYGSHAYCASLSKRGIDPTIVLPHNYNTCTSIRYESAVDCLTPFHHLSALSHIPMPKIRDSGLKPNLFEVATTQTRRGKRITHVPVKDTQPSPAPSRSVSPLKKRALSPETLEFVNDDDDPREQVPKRSRTAGKVSTPRSLPGTYLSSARYLQTQNEFLKEYLNRRHSILIELLRHEAFPSTTSCSLCQQSSATHRCYDCFGSNIWCGPCCISAHKSLPFHRVQMWNGQFFEWSDLLVHRLTLDLRHYLDDCPFTQLTTETDMLFDLDLSDNSDEFTDGHRSFADAESTTNVGSRSTLIIVSSTGIFKRSVRWCHCARTPAQYLQLLLRARLFPASFKNPKTAFTFKVLDHFQVDALECKTAAMSFMNKIKRITNEAFPLDVPVTFQLDRMMFQC